FRGANQIARILGDHAQRGVVGGRAGLRGAVAVDLADLRAERAAASRLRALQVCWVDDVGLDARRRRQRGSRGADVAGRDTTDLSGAELNGARDGYPDDAVLVGERRSVGRVV